MKGIEDNIKDGSFPPEDIVLFLLEGHVLAVLRTSSFFVLEDTSLFRKNCPEDIVLIFPEKQGRGVLGGRSVLND